MYSVKPDYCIARYERFLPTKGINSYKFLLISNLFKDCSEFGFINSMKYGSFLSLRGLLRRLYGVVIWEYNTIFNTKYFIISSKPVVLCNRNRSVVLAYIYLHTHTRSYRRESDDDRHAHTYTHPCLPLILCVHKHTHTSQGSSFIALPGVLHDTHTQVAVCWRFV